MKLNIVTGFFLPVPPVRGGATEKIWYRLSHEFVRRGHEVTFISRQWPGFSNRCVEEGVRQIRVKGSDHSRYLPINLLHDFVWGLSVAPVLPQADVTLCNNVSLPIWLSTFKPNAGRVVAVVARMPKGQTRLYRRVDRVLSLSNELSSRLLAENPKLAGKIGPFPFPIDWQLHAKQARPTDSDSISIGYIGRIHPEKGVNLLLGAAELLAAKGSSLPKWRIKVQGPVSVQAGGGGEKWRDKLVETYRETLGDKLEFLAPEYDPKALAARYRQLDIFVYPSLAESGETFGVAVAEAMAAGAVPVVSNLACFTDLVVAEKTGLVFNHSALDAKELLAGAIERLLIDVSLRRSLALAAKAHTAQFDFEPVAEGLLDQLEALRPNSQSGK